MVYYFAYGSNMDEMRMKGRVDCYSIIGGGILTGYNLRFNKIDDKSGAGYANIVLDSESIVEGVIYKVDEIAISKLDINEGTKNHHYYRKQVKVETNGEILNCEVYIAYPERINDKLKPTKTYLDHLLAGKPYLSEKYYREISETKTID